MSTTAPSTPQVFHLPTATGIELARKYCELVQQLSQPRAALTLASTDTHLFVGVADNDDSQGLIQVWHLNRFHLEKELRGHARAVSSLVVAGADKNLLISAAHDCTLWDTRQLECLCVLRPHLLVGDVFSLACTTRSSHIFMGCQNASIQAKPIDLVNGVFAGSRPAAQWSASTMAQTPSPDAIIKPPPLSHSPYLMSSSHSANGRRVFAANLLSAVPVVRQSHLMAAEGAALTYAANEDILTKASSSDDSVSSTADGGDTTESATASDAPTTTTTTTTTSSFGGLSIKVGAPLPRSIGHPSVLMSARSPRNNMLASVDRDHVFSMSHNGYVYCMTTAVVVLDGVQTEVVISGSGDGSIKIWNWRPERPTLELFKVLRLPSTVSSVSSAVLCLLIHEGFLYAGLQGGCIAIWDLETFECTRQLAGHSDDVNALVICQGQVFSGSADGTVRMIGRTFECLQVLGNKTSGRNVLSLAASQDMLVVGSNAGSIEVWRVPPIQSKPILLNNEEDSFLSALEKFVALRTVSGDESLREECRAGAKFLNRLSLQLGAESKLVPGAQGKNPIVIAKFMANDEAVVGSKARVPTLLYYGHYDVQPAKEKEWNTPPFSLTGIDGYLYGRGATDNKGPVLAALFGVSEMWRAEALPANVVLVIEGEEESGSDGIAAALSSCDSWLKKSGPVDCIMIANTYWLSDDVPCVTYGLRGVVRATLSIAGLSENLHSGVDGGVVAEPLVDLVQLLGTLRDSKGQVNVPHFYDNVREPSQDQLDSYSRLSLNCDKYAVHPIGPAAAAASSKANTSDDSNSDNPADDGHTFLSMVPSSLPPKAQILSARWDRPTLSIHNVHVSGPGTNTVIPSSASAKVSMRLVPDQSVEFITHQFRAHVVSKYRQLNTRNHLEIDITDTAGWWLGEKDGLFFEAAKQAIRKVWEVEPQQVREGGTIPVTRFLEDWFNAPAVHLPLGQCSDAAHLPNERIRVRNLQLGREVIQQFIYELVENSNKDKGPEAVVADATPAATAAAAAGPIGRRKLSSYKYTVS